MKALAIHAGPRALRALQAHGLRPGDVRIIPAAAGGPKGLILNELDRFIFGDWLPRSAQTVHLLGASIGAWRMATACLANPDAGFAGLARDYIAQQYPHLPGRLPSAATVSALFAEQIAQCFGGHEAEILNHARFRLHVFTSRGRHVLRREGRWRTPLGYLGAFASNALSRRALGGWIERVVFSDPRDALPLQLPGLRTRRVTLNENNLHSGLLASCSIPFCVARRARHCRRTAGRVLGRRHHRLPPAPGLRHPARRRQSGAGSVPAFPEHGGAGLARQDAQAPPPRHAAARQPGSAVTAAASGWPGCRTASCRIARTSSAMSTTLKHVPRPGPAQCRKARGCATSSRTGWSAAARRTCCRCPDRHCAAVIAACVSNVSEAQ